MVEFGGTASDPLTTLDVSEDFLSGTSVTGQLGALGWGYAGGGFGAVAAVANHPGIIRRDTSTTISTLAYLRILIATGQHPLLGSDNFDLTWVFRLNVNDSNTRVRLGLTSDATIDAPVSGIYLEKQAADTSWFGTVRAASTESRTAALAAVDTNWRKVRIRRLDTSTVGFTLDALAEVTIATNVPTAGLHPFTQIFNADAVLKSLDHDYFRLKIIGLGR